MWNQPEPRVLERTELEKWHKATVDVGLEEPTSCVDLRQWNKKLWSWSCLGDHKVLEMPQPWDTCNKEWKQVTTKEFVVVTKDEWSWRSEEYFDIKHGDTEFAVCPADFGLVWSSISLLWHFGVVVYSLMLKVCGLPFNFYFIGHYS